MPLAIGGWALKSRLALRMGFVCLHQCSTMTPEQQRFRYHAKADPELCFWMLGDVWELFDGKSITDDKVCDARAGLVTYPSGEVLCQFGGSRMIPDGVHFMVGPVYQDHKPGYHSSLVRNGEGGVEVWHGPSRSQEGDSRYYYSTVVLNRTCHRIRVTKFAPFKRGLMGIRKEPETGYYSPTQFREWFRVKDEQGWIAPGEQVADPDNYGSGSGIWAYFFETDQGDQFIATSPLENRRAFNKDPKGTLPRFKFE